MPRERLDPREMAPLRDAIRRRIHEQGFSHGEAADRVGVERRLLTHYQNSLRSMPSPSQWRRLVEGLGLDAVEVLRSLGYLA